MSTKPEMEIVAAHIQLRQPLEIFELLKKLKLIISASHFMTSKLFHFQLPLKMLKRWSRKRKIKKKIS